MKITRACTAKMTSKWISNPSQICREGPRKRVGMKKMNKKCNKITKRANRFRWMAIK